MLSSADGKDLSVCLTAPTIHDKDLVSLAVPKEKTWSVCFALQREVRPSVCLNVPKLSLIRRVMAVSVF